MPRPIRKRLDHYYDVADTRSIALFPLVVDTGATEDPNCVAAMIRDKDSTRGKLVGVMVVEGTDCELGRFELEELWRQVRPVFKKFDGRSNELGVICFAVCSNPVH